MISNDERNRLMRAYMREPDCAWAVVLRCAAGFAIIALIALIGFQGTSVDQDRAVWESTMATESAALSHSRQLYQERADAFRATHENRTNAGPSFPSAHAESLPGKLPSELDEMMLLRASD